MHPDGARAAGTLSAGPLLPGPAPADERDMLRRVLRGANVGLWDWDVLSNRVYFSPEWKRQIGYEPHEIADDFEEWRSRVHPDDLDRMLAAINRYLEHGGGEYRQEFRFRHRDGSYRTILTEGAVDRDADGRAVRLYGSHVDVTDRREAQEALREGQRQLQRAHERLALATRAAALGVWDWDVAENVLEWDDRMFELYGVSRGHAVAYTAWLAGVHPEDRARSNEETRKALTGEADFDTQFRVLWPDGTVRHLRAHAIVVRDEDGRPVRMTGVNYDITESVASEAALRASDAALRELAASLEHRVTERTAELVAANRELEAFSYAVSHDLRAPLRAIDGFSRILSERHAEALGDDGRAHLRRIVGAVGRMGHLIDDLLTLSRITRADFACRPVDASAMAREVLEGLRQQEPERRVDTVVSDGIVLHADARLLRVLLENLLGNAWKFTSKHPAARIEFGTVPAGGGHRACYVRDDGVGFDMEYAGKLFVPFQRLHATTDFPGSGVGLATVQRVVARHGGRAWAESQVGRGATFYFTIPD